MKLQTLVQVGLPLFVLGCGGPGDGQGFEGGGGALSETGGAGGEVASGGALGAGGAADAGSGGVGDVEGSGGGLVAGDGGAAASGGDGGLGPTGGAEAGGSGGVPTGTGGADTGGAGTGGAGTGGAGTGGAGASSAGGAGGESGCPFSGNVHYQFNGAESWPADVAPLLTAALDEATSYYNCYADLTKEITVNYKPDVPTAEANVDGWMSFGSNRGYMVTATAMHEIGHTLGVGYAPWAELISDGRWIGPAVDDVMAQLPPEQRDPDMYSQRDYITCDTQHFWPYGLNQASEHQSEWSLINHVRVVAAMNADKRAFLAGEL